MGRRKKVVDVVETPTEMNEDAMNAPVEEEINDFVEPQTENRIVFDNKVESVVEDVPNINVPVVEENEEEYVEEAPKPLASEPVFKKIQCSASLVNVREKPDGDVMFTIRNLSKVRVEGEENGWVKISGYVMKELVKDL